MPLVDQAMHTAGITSIDYIDDKGTQSVYLVTASTDHCVRLWKQKVCLWFCVGFSWSACGGVVGHGWLMVACLLRFRQP